MTDAIIPDVTEKRGPGRPKGLGRVPGSGRKAGVPNKLTTDLKELILAKGKPVEYLIDVVRGVKIRVGAPAGPGQAQYVYPTPEMRLDAAKFLAGRVLPVASTVEVTGDPERPVALAMAESPLGPEREAARRILFLLARADEEGGGEAQLDAPAALLAAADFRQSFTREPEPEPVPVAARAPAALPPNYDYVAETGHVYRDGQRWTNASTLDDAIELAVADAKRRTP